jgi:uncharacterized membrane protein
MSREERRNYERMMRNMERGPALPPAAKARAERNAARRAARRQEPAAPGRFTSRFWVVTTLIALAAGYLAFSLQFHNMPFALYLGVVAAIVVFALQIGIRVLRGRVTSPEDSRPR